MNETSYRGEESVFQGDVRGCRQGGRNRDTNTSAS